VIKLGLIMVQQLHGVAGDGIVALKPIAAFALLYILLYFFPYNALFCNQFRAAAFTLFLWTTLVEVIRLLGVPESMAGDIMLLGIGPSVYIGQALAYRRWLLVTQRLPPLRRVLEIITSGNVEAERALIRRLSLEDGDTDLDIMVRHVMRHSNSSFVGLQGSDDHHVHQFSIFSLLGISFNDTDEMSKRDDASVHSNDEGDESTNLVEMASRAKKRWVSYEKRVLVMQWLYTRAAGDLGESGRFWLSILNTHHFYGQNLPVRMSASSAIKVNSLDLRYCLFRYLFERRRQQLAEGVGTVRYLDLSKALRAAQKYHRKALREMQ